MSEQNTNGTTQRPFAQFTEQFSRIMQEQLGYGESMQGEWSKLREKNVGLMQEAMSDYTKLMRAGMEFQTGLMGDMQKISMDAMRQSMSWMKS